MRSKGFTLIELLAVIVILAIIALIATPVILGIIDDARKSTNEQSINLYGRAIENAVANYLLKHPSESIPKGNYSQRNKGKTLIGTKTLTVDYDGNEVLCDVININSDGSVYLASCKVNGVSVEYTYGKKTEKACYISKDEDEDGFADIGDMITCGTENFYVISNDGENIEMLAEKNITLPNLEETT